MRKSVALLLLVSAAAPAFAAADPDNRDSRRAEREAERAERSQARSQARQERQAERPQQVERAAPPAPVQNRNVNGGGNPAAGGGERARLRTPDQRREVVEQRRETIEQRRAGRDGTADGARVRPQPSGPDGVRVWRDEQRERVRGPRSGLGHVAAPPPGARPDRPAPPPKVTPNEFFRHVTPWHSNWRNDHRYDWRQHRDRNRWLFNLGFYYDPFGWGYQRHSIGWRMYPSYYSSSYWLDDPWQYRLPPAYGPYRWVRYWDDALLINTYTGEVVDVMYSFFW